MRLRDDYRQFKLERLRRLELLSERYNPRPGFSLTKYLERNHADMQLFPARVWFSVCAIERARRESYVGLKNEMPDRDGFAAEIKTYSYSWLARWILSFGGEAEALEPEELRSQVLRFAELAISHHDPILS